MARSFQTAQAIRKVRPDVSCTVSKDLRELTPAHFLPLGPTGEQKDGQRVAREQKSLARFARRLRRHHRIGQCVLIVAHGNLIRALIPTLRGQPLCNAVLLHTDHTSVAVLRIQRKPAGRMMLMLTNCTRHLPASMVTA
jgi:broad specificity phosphatase PhoE